MRVKSKYLYCYIHSHKGINCIKSHAALSACSHRSRNKKSQIKSKSLAAAKTTALILFNNTRSSS